MPDIAADILALPTATAVANPAALIELALRKLTDLITRFDDPATAYLAVPVTAILLLLVLW
jgi:hypothetical protein